MCEKIVRFWNYQMFSPFIELSPSLKIIVDSVSACSLELTMDMRPSHTAITTSK